MPKHHHISDEHPPVELQGMTIQVREGGTHFIETGIEPGPLLPGMTFTIRGGDESPPDDIEEEGPC